MPNQPTPPDPSQIPDPARSYERAKPEAEAGMGRLDNNNATPENAPDRAGAAVHNHQDPARQLNAHEVVDDRAKRRLATNPSQPDHSMHEEEPDGWDLAPTDIRDPRHKRHPRTEGKGGTP